jgi:WD40 repeat protein
VWDGRTFAELATLKGHDDRVSSVAVSPDGAVIITGSGDQTAKVWDARTFSELATLKGHYGSVTSVAASAVGSRIVTGSSDNTAKVWDARTFGELATLKGHGGAVLSVAVTPDGSRIITGAGDIYTGLPGSEDKTAKVWDAKTFVELATLKGHGGPVQSVVVSPDGSRIVTGSNDKTAKVWQFFPSGQALVADAQRAALRCLTLAQRQRFHLAPSPPAWCVDRRLWPYHTDDWQAWLLKRKAWLDIREGPEPALPKDAAE